MALAANDRTALALEQADVERQKAELERQKANRLAAKLRELGLDPDAL